MGCGDAERTSAQDAAAVRVATYNIEDVRTSDVKDPDQPRLKKAAALIQRVRPDVLLVNEMTYDQPGAPDVRSGEAAGQNGQRFADNFLAVAQGPGLEPIRYRAFAAPTNTGLASHYDLDRSGKAVTTYPAPPPPNPDGSPGPQTDAGRAYGNDSWGFGVFPGQYGMVLLVREGLEVLGDSVRTFRLLPWQAMPDASLPVVPETGPETGEPWYAGEAGERFRLSSKSHWDVPVRLPNGAVLHVLASHPTPPAFDGEEGRNRRRNRDEIRFWTDYLDGADYVRDDSGRVGGLPEEAPFVLVGDLNADPDEGSTFGNPISEFLLDHARVQADVTPTADRAGQAAYPDLDPDDTARWGLRVDYVLPSDGRPGPRRRGRAARRRRHRGRGTQRPLPRLARPRRAPSEPLIFVLLPSASCDVVCLREVFWSCSSRRGVAGRPSRTSKMQLAKSRPLSKKRRTWATRPAPPATPTSTRPTTAPAWAARSPASTPRRRRSGSAKERRSTSRSPTSTTRRLSGATRSSSASTAWVRAARSSTSAPTPPPTSSDPATRRAPTSWTSGGN